MEVNWESPRPNPGESQIPGRRRLRRMDALNPLSPGAFNSEVSHHCLTRWCSRLTMSTSTVTIPTLCVDLLIFRLCVALRQIELVQVVILSCDWLQHQSKGEAMIEMLMGQFSSAAI